MQRFLSKNVSQLFTPEPPSAPVALGIQSYLCWSVPAEKGYKSGSFPWSLLVPRKESLAPGAQAPITILSLFMHHSK